MSRIRDLMMKKRAFMMSVKPDMPVGDALRLLVSYDADDLPVIEGEELCGIFPGRGCLREVLQQEEADRNMRVKDCMETKWVSVLPEQRIEECLPHLYRGPVRHFAVMEQKKVLGVFTRDEIMRCIIEMQATRIDELEKYISGGYLIKSGVVDGKVHGSGDAAADCNEFRQ